jgi:hypothetical protein
MRTILKIETSIVRRIKSLLALSLLCSSTMLVYAIEAPTKLEAQGGHRRVDIHWEEQYGHFYEIQRSEHSNGPFVKVHEGTRMTPRYSDFIQKNGVKKYYRVRSLTKSKKDQSIVETSEWSKVVSASSRYQNRSELLRDLQRANFEFIWSYAHPESGLIREATNHATNVKHSQFLWRCTTVGATGMGFFNIGVGIKKGWISREQGVARVLKTIKFLRDKTTRYHGVWAHWIDGSTGETIPFSTYDDGADLVETSFLAKGLIFVRELFDGDSPHERELRSIAQQLWSEIQWDFFFNGDEKDPQLLWHWSPNHGFKINLGIRGVNECHITHLLAMISPTHSISSQAYENAWLNPIYQEERKLEGVDMSLSKAYGGPLFYTHYSYLGFNPRTIAVKGESYFDHYVKFCHAQYGYAKKHYPSFDGQQIWGLTASANPDGYQAHHPGPGDNGTLTPTASLSSWPYAPDYAMESFLAMYEGLGASIWGEYGFVDAFNPKRNWVNPGHISIDVATIAPMIENHLSGFCWEIFHQSPESKQMIQLLEKYK